MSATETRQEILHTIKTAESLPTLPDIMIKVRETADNPNSNVSDLVKILENDPAIVGRILKVVNSPVYASVNTAPITDIHQAIVRTGFREVKNIALSTSVLKACKDLPERIFDRRAYWKHCMCTAFMSVRLSDFCDAQRRKLPRDLLHLGGLTHDVGRLLLETFFPKKLEACLKAAVKLNKPLFEIEKLLLGIDHSELGYVLAKQWNFPDSILATIAYHHSPKQAPESTSSLVSLIHLANYTVNTQDLGTGGDFARPVFEQSAWEITGLSPSTIATTVSEVIEQESELTRVLS